MRAKRIITRVILSAAAAGSIAAGVAVPLTTAVAPTATVVASHMRPDVIVVYG